MQHEHDFQDLSSPGLGAPSLSARGLVPLSNRNLSVRIPGAADRKCESFTRVVCADRSPLPRARLFCKAALTSAVSCNQIAQEGSLTQPLTFPRLERSSLWP